VTPEIDTTVPHSARIWNFWLGGKDNFEIDRRVGMQLQEAYPAIVDLARSDRLFLRRAVRYLAGEAGVRQFLDVGTGLPTLDNTHVVAQQVAPESRIVYVDNDPLVLAHARALLTSAPEGATDYLDADFREPEQIVSAAASTLDFAAPVAVLLLGILGHFPDDSEVAGLIGRLMAATVPGSYLAIAHGSSASSGLVEAARQYASSGAASYTLRSPEQLEQFFGGLELVPPGVSPTPRWRPDVGPVPKAEDVHSYCAVGRKP
jgi:O-methyltransferase involved in polyketide biosynthesis